MNWTDWYTDLMDVYRTAPVKDGNLTRHERAKVLEKVPCRIYQSDNKPISMSQTASSVVQNDHLACTSLWTFALGTSSLLPGAESWEGRAPPSWPLPATPTPTMSHSGPSCRDWPTRKSG